MPGFEKKQKALIDHLVKHGILRTKSIIDAFTKVPRHLFIPEENLAYAYDDIALPTVNQSTISQPSTVALMLELLQPKAGDKILEIGTGSAWEACLLSRCASKVVTIEIDPEVEAFARSNIAMMGFTNIDPVSGDGSAGYMKDAPYDKITYTAATPAVSEQVLKQLKVKGRVVAPVGSMLLQTMKVMIKESESKIEEKSYGTYQFIPLGGKLGFR